MNKFSKQLLFTGVVLFTILCLFCLKSTGARTKYTEGEIYQDVGRNVFMMLNPSNESSGGTGFAVRDSVKGQLYTLSNAHVCALSKTGYLIARQGAKARRLRIIDIATDMDLCLLEGFDGYEGLPIAESVELYQRVYIVGHPYLHPITITAGYVNGRAKLPISYCEMIRYFQLDQLLEQLMPDCMKFVDSVIATAASAPGNSGSPVVDEYEYVVGVLFAGDGSGLSLVVPLDKIQEFMNRH